MADLLVRLYDLPPLAPAFTAIERAGFEVRRALAPERHLVLPWVAEHFSAAWADECEAAFARQPLACFLALQQGQLCGFGAYEAACRNFFGPIGVLPHCHGKQLGKTLLLAGLHAMHAEGYAYAIIGSAGPVGFFQKAAGAVEIAGSSPGIYRGMLRPSGPGIE